MKYLISLFMLVPAMSFSQAADREYSLTGTIAGYYMADNAECYIALKTSSNYYYNYGYHEIKKRHMCDFAKAMYLLGGNVTVLIYVANKTGVPNTVVRLEATRDAHPYWPGSGYNQHKKN